MALYLLTYQCNGRLAGVAIASADSVTAARTHSIIGIGDALVDEVIALDRESAPFVPTHLFGKMLPRKEASDLLHAIAKGIGQVR